MTEPLAIVTGLKAGQVLGEARNSDEMLEIWRATRERIGLSNAHCDELANFTLGHIDKLLGPAGSKNFGPKTFTGLNWTFAIKWLAVVDAEQLAIMEQYWQDRQRQVSHVRPTPSRISKAVLARAKPIVLRELGEKLASAFGDDIGQILAGMKLPDRSGDNAKTDAAKRLDEDERDTLDSVEGGPPRIIVSEPAPPARTPAPGRAHLRVVQTKRGSKYG